MIEYLEEIHQYFYADSVDTSLPELFLRVELGNVV
jgi:hypothetical protein